jgi:hypothetical protein
MNPEPLKLAAVRSVDETMKLTDVHDPLLGRPFHQTREGSISAEVRSESLLESLEQRSGRIQLDHSPCRWQSRPVHPGVPEKAAGFARTAA